MPIKATPFQHQRDAFDFACGLFGLTEQSDKRSPGVATPSRKSSATGPPV